MPIASPSEVRQVLVCWMYYDLHEAGVVTDLYLKTMFEVLLCVPFFKTVFEVFCCASYLEDCVRGLVVVLHTRKTAFEVLLLSSLLERPCSRSCDSPILGCMVLCCVDMNKRKKKNLQC